MSKFDEPTISKAELVELAVDRLSYSEAKAVLRELGIEFPTGTGRVNISINDEQLPSLAFWGKQRLINYLQDHLDKISDVSVEEFSQEAGEPTHLDKALVLEVALKQKRARGSAWCTDGFIEAMNELGIRLPPQRVYQVSFDIREEDLLGFSQGSTVESFTIESAFEYLDETDSEEVKGFKLELTDRTESPN